MSCLDILVIMEKNCYEDTKKLKEKYNFLFGKYNFSTDSWNKTTILFYSSYEGDESLIFDGRECKICCDFYSKLKYAMAGLYNDDLLLKTLQEIFGEDYIQSLDIPSVRYTVDYYLKQWMKQYGFDLKEFLLNRKYIVISDNERFHHFYQLSDLGLINWKDIAHCSEEFEED